MKKKNITWNIFFKRFFNKFMLIGILLILIAGIIELCEVEEYIVDLIITVLNSIGIALVVGAIFDYAKNSEGFMNYISELLKDIILSKNFLNDLDINSKKQALEMVLRPSGNQLEQCSDIEEYFKKKINESTEMFQTNFKTNLTISSRAVKENEKVVVYSTLSYRIYKISDKYLPIRTSFESANGKLGKTKILYPNGSIEIEETKCTPVEQQEISPTALLEYSFEIPKNLYEHRYLTLKKEVIEEGHDHWASFHWNTLTPSDGIRFDLLCEDGLQIKEYFICDDVKLYNIDIAEDKKSGSIVSSSWLDANTGFIFIISDTE